MNEKKYVKLPFNPLVILLIIASLVIGLLYSKVTNLEKQTLGAKAETQVNTDNTYQQPPEATVGDLDPITEDDHIRGDVKKAKVALIEYSDLECPFCKKFHTTAIQAVEEYKGDLVWVYRHFPLDQLHSKARKEAEATECAAELGGNDAFWLMTDKIFETTQGNNSLDLDILPNLAQGVGLDKAKFISCLDSDKFKDKIEKQYQSGVKAGINGTPGNILMNLETKETKLIPGAVPFETLKSEIDKML